MNVDHDERIARLRAWGTIMALHTFHLRNGPYPISPFLYFYIMMSGPRYTKKGSLKMSDLPLEIIRHFDPNSGRLLDKWQELDLDDQWPSNPNGPNGDLFSLCCDAFGGNTVRNQFTYLCG